MKKTISLALTICLFVNGFAQVKSRDILNTTTTTDSRKKMPDLVITKVKISGRYKNANSVEVRDITYEIKNEGNAAPAYFVELEGFLTNDDVYNWATMAKGCTDIVENATVMLAPGKTVTKTFTCGSAIIKNGYRYYVLRVDYRERIAEQNENNNHNIALIN